MKQYDIALIGGDARIAYMAEGLWRKGYRVISYGIRKMSENMDAYMTYAQSLQEAVCQSTYIVGGIPLIKNGNVNGSENMQEIKEESFVDLLKQNQVVFGGVISDYFLNMCRQKNVSCYDFMKNEALAIFNAIATAEGAILEALKNKETNIHGSKSLVLGYGRCGRVLCDKLKGMGACVTLCSRDSIELAMANTYGLDCIPLEQLENHLGEYEYIYNTIPAVIFQKSLLENIRKDALLIDLASGQGGVDYEEAKNYESRVRHCLGLPGKYAPKVSARALNDFVIQKVELEKVDKK